MTHATRTVQQTNQAGTSLVGYPCLRANPSQENKENKITMPSRNVGREFRESLIETYRNRRKILKHVETC